MMFIDCSVFWDTRNIIDDSLCISHMKVLRKYNAKSLFIISLIKQAGNNSATKPTQNRFLKQSTLTYSGPYCMC